MTKPLLAGLVVTLFSGSFSTAVLADVEASLRAYENRDCQRAIAELQPLSELKDARAQYILYRIYAYGEWSCNPSVVKDDVEAIKWLAAAAENGYPQAQFTLGENYLRGWYGLKRDGLEAVKWVRKAAEQNFSDAQFAMGKLVKSQVEKNDWWRKASENGNQYGAYWLGWSYLKGKGVPENRAKAKILFRKAAELGNIEGEITLGDISVEEGDYAQAEDWYLAATKHRFDRGRDAKRLLNNLYALVEDLRNIEEKRRKEEAERNKAPQHVYVQPIAPKHLQEKHRNSIAVIIGNKDYLGDIPDVDFAHNDADAVRGFLLEKMGYREGNFIDLRDASLNEMAAVLGNERSADGKLSDWIQSEDSDVVVYYSGHGVPGQIDKSPYLLPVNGDANKAEITGYPLEVLYKNLANLPVRSVSVFIDACFSGKSPNGPVIKSASGISITPKVPRSSTRLSVITAAQGDQLASWDEEAKLGLFTKVLLQGLSGGADKGGHGDSDGRVSLGELENFLEDKMTYQAKRTWGRNQKAYVQGGKEVELAFVTEDVERSHEGEFEIEPMNAKYAVLKNSNLRAGPSTRTSVVGKLGANSTVHITGKVVERDWYRIDRGSFVSGALITPFYPPYSSSMGVGSVFKDCLECPEMVIVPRGTYRMGKVENDDLSGPTPKEVTITYSFAVSRYEVTFDEWDACARSGGCGGYHPDSLGWGRGRRPVINVNFNDANEFTWWISSKTGHHYGLLSKAEWEYMARAGTETLFHFGNGISKYRANYLGSKLEKTVEVGNYPPNAFGVFDVHGNVGEIIANSSKRGGSFESWHVGLYSRKRGRSVGEYRGSTTGFRIARPLN